MAVTILGISVFGIFGAMSTFLQAGTVDRSIADINQVVRTYSEGLNAASYAPCASSYSSVTIPSGYAFSAGPTVRYWNGDNPATFASSCVTDKGVQQISATVGQSVSGQTQQLVVVKSSG